jgi:hypothetical protein
MLEHSNQAMQWSKATADCCACLSNFLDRLRGSPRSFGSAMASGILTSAALGGGPEGVMLQLAGHRAVKRSARKPELG